MEEPVSAGEQELVQIATLAQTALSEIEKVYYAALEELQRIEAEIKEISKEIPNMYLKCNNGIYYVYKSVKRDGKVCSVYIGPYDKLDEETKKKLEHKKENRMKLKKLRHRKAELESIIKVLISRKKKIEKIIKAI
ncbi:hypothetical protein [Thermosulfidibacter takaii]|uniref:hypothetical protein n=1 Tax=Thermosulfidibacter takaii TaxID=412593 RepID=UPI0008395B3B|nr:hypothetical protein [Thermosulfidibacter takaii]